MGSRNRNSERANLGEQMDNNQSELDSNNVEQSDRSMHADSRGDGMAGSEGIEDPMLENGRQQGRESTDDASSFSGQGAQKEGRVTQGEGTGYTGSSREGSQRESTRQDSTRKTGRGGSRQTGRQNVERNTSENTESDDSRVQ